VESDRGGQAGRPGLLLHDVRRLAVRNLERGHLPLHRDEADSYTTEAVYRLYAIVAESDLRDAGTKLAAMPGTTTEPRRLSDRLRGRFR